MPAPDPGKLNQQITIQQRVTTKDAEGGMVDSWTDFAANVWAKVNNLSGNERSATAKGGEKLESRTEFTIYYIDGVTNKMRVSFGGKYHNIRHVNNFMEANEYLIITCDTGGNDGR